MTYKDLTRLIYNKVDIRHADIDDAASVAKYKVWVETVCMLTAEKSEEFPGTQEYKTVHIRSGYSSAGALKLAREHPETIDQIAALLVLVYGDTPDI